MRIDHKTGPWWVFHGEQEIMGVEWVDPDSAQYSQFASPPQICGDEFVTTVHQAASIDVDWRTKRITIQALAGPAIPAEVHNHRPINADVCMAAVRVMCGGA